MLVVAAPARPPTTAAVSAAPTRKTVGTARLVQTSPAMMLATTATSLVGRPPQTSQDGRSIAGRKVISTSPGRRTGTSAVTAATTRMVASDAASQLPGVKNKPGSDIFAPNLRADHTRGCCTMYDLSRRWLRTGVARPLVYGSASS